MVYTVDYLEDIKIICVKMKGRLNFQIAEQYSKEAVKLARHYDCSKFIIDHTETTVQGGVNKIHVAGAELQQFGFKNTDLIAVVIANLADDPNLLEPIIQNSRWCVLKFFSAENIQEAYDWLSENS